MSGRKIDNTMCTGCGACEAICELGAISIQLDSEGYKRAVIDENKCVDCAKCGHVCHMQKEIKTNDNKKNFIYAAVSNDKSIIMDSSSGGVFNELAKYFIEAGGVVYGAGMTDELRVVHRRIKSVAEIASIRKSKYVESDTRGVYKVVQEDINRGIPVLFSGTGCQIAGLYSSVENKSLLFTCEVVCHGIPSETVFNEYLMSKESKLDHIDFRDKRNGWLSNSISEKYIDGNEYVVHSDSHPFHEIYLKGINMRPECGRCRYAKLPRVADVTLADFWKYRGKLFSEYEKYGISLVVVNNEKGKYLFEKISNNLSYDTVSLDEAMSSCRHLTNPPLEHCNRDSFYKLLPMIGYEKAALVCKTFERVVLANDLYITSQVDIAEISETFVKNDSEVIYVENKDHKIIGTITFDSFVNHILYDDILINETYPKVGLMGLIDRDVIALFKMNTKLERVPIINNNGSILCEVSRRKSPRISSKRKEELKTILPLVELMNNNIAVSFIKRPDYLPDKQYSDAQISRITNKESFIEMSDNFTKYKDTLDLIIGKECSYEYITELRRIPPICEIGDIVTHIDQSAEFVNVVCGERITKGQPSSWEHSVYMYGRCGVFGYAVEDGETIPSHLQKIVNLNNKKIRIVNRGVWGAETKAILSNILHDQRFGRIQRGDQVVVYMDSIPYLELLKNIGLGYFDTTDDFYNESKDKDLFYDKPGHMNGEGYSIVAKLIYNLFDEKCWESTPQNVLINRYFKLYEMIASNLDVRTDDVRDYLLHAKEKLGNSIGNNKCVGSIVMNCNPFTLGHRYLIEKAASLCDTLIVFVLEEDKSIFPFQDRYEMVKIGTENISNVKVIPSGKFVLSSLTFPEYFLKEQLKEATIDATGDIRLFAESVAPELNINKRFVGTEPIDKVTAQYNSQLKQILPNYGVELIEIERLKNKNEYISATKVRKAITDNEKIALLEMVPKSTYEFLLDKEYIK